MSGIFHKCTRTRPCVRCLEKTIEFKTGFRAAPRPVDNIRVTPNPFVTIVFILFKISGVYYRIQIIPIRFTDKRFLSCESEFFCNVLSRK